MNDRLDSDPRLYAIPDIHGHAKGEHKAFSDERPIPLSARMLFLWFYHACRRGWPRFLMVTDHMNYLTFEDPAAINLVRRALKLAQAGDLYGAAETASVDVGHASVVSDGLRRGMRYSIGAEVDNDPRSRPDAQNIVDAMKPDGMIRSVHFLTIDHPAHGPNWSWPFDNPEFADVYDVVGTAKTWELYMATLLDAIERLPGDIVGHFYVPAIFGHWPDDATLDGYENALVDACEARGMAIEFNTRFLYRNHSAEQKANYLRAYRRLLAKCKAKNVGVAVGSDAHSPKDQGGAFATVLAVLDECEINELVFPLAGRLARVALRVERKIEPPPELPPAPPPEERKSARKARPLETPVREVTAVAVAADNVAPDAPKPKRPKRSKVKSAPSSEFIPTPSESDDGTLAAAGNLAVEPTWSGPDDDSSTDSAGQTRWVVESTLVVATQPTGEIDSALVIDAEPVDAVPEIQAAGEADSVVVIDAVLGDAVPQTQPAGETDSAVGHTLSKEETHWVEQSDSPAQTDSLVVSPPLVVGEAVVSEAIGEIVSEAELEPIVSLAEAEPSASDEPVVEIGAIVLETAGTEGAAEAQAQVDSSKAAPTKGKPAPKKAAKPAAKSAAKKAAPKKALAKKAAALKAAAKKSATKKSAAKKAAAKKASVKKAAVRAAGAKKAAAKKAAAKKANPKKPAQRRR